MPISGWPSTAASRGGAKHLTDAGIQLFDAQEPLELARMIKTPEEIMAMQLSMDVCDVGVDRIRQALQPGSPRTSCGASSTRPTSPTTASGSSAAC